jgi:hypothetical protein
VLLSSLKLGFLKNKKCHSFLSEKSVSKKVSVTDTFFRSEGVFQSSKYINLREYMHMFSTYLQRFAKKYVVFWVTKNDKIVALRRQKNNSI